MESRILQTLPKVGRLSPAFHDLGANHGATEFRRAGVKRVILHPYRYAWAERVKAAGYPERFVQIALGHSSRVVHEAYAQGAQVQLLALADYEQMKEERVVPLHRKAAAG
ncbi:MAG: hypothetical protein H7A46_18765 [Verrucomicrobiales bacterium]|nr:hypothetical protein [Verrucomicrobiales bacterium]